MFERKKSVVIGMVHCAPLLGYDNFPGFKTVKRKFLQDLKALVRGGVDAIMIENNYDLPHYEYAKKSTIPHLTELCLEARKITKKPLGLCVLWNDYEAALSIAKIAEFNFVRIPVFVDKVKTDYGIFKGKAEECMKFRKEIDAENILIFADVQVKHAKHLIKRPLNEAVKDAIRSRADAVIITGKWTGDAPSEGDVLEAKKSSSVPVILGSGITPENIKKYSHIDGFIIGTYFKGEKKEEVGPNIFSWEARIQEKRVRKIMQSLN